MTDHKPDSPPIAESWDSYWHGAEHGAAFTGGGTTHPLILSFWDALFTGVKDQYDSPRIIDIASGSGAVVESAQSVFDGKLPNFTCLDVSESAITLLKQRFPDVHGIVADARSIPLDAAAYDVGTSQFGVEYAGLDAIDEVARLIAPGGQLALLLHHRAGGIYKQCAASLDAIEKVQEAGFIPSAITMFEQGFAADRVKYEAAVKRFQPAVRAIESIMQQHGPDVADGTIVRLYKDVRTIHSRMRHYDPSEVMSWLTRLRAEIQAYAGRMASMCDVAIDANAFEDLCATTQDNGYRILRGEPLVLPDGGLPLAWALVAMRS